MLAKARDEFYDVPRGESASRVSRRSVGILCGGMFGVVAVAGVLAFLLTGALVLATGLPLLWGIPVYGMTGAILSLAMAAAVFAASNEED